MLACGALRNACSAARFRPWDACRIGARPALFVRHLRTPRASRDQFVAAQSDAERRSGIADASPGEPPPASPSLAAADQRAWATYRTVSVDGQVYRDAVFGLIRLDGDNCAADDGLGKSVEVAASRASTTSSADEIPPADSSGHGPSSSTVDDMPGDFFGIESYAAAVAKRAELRHLQVRTEAAANSMPKPTATDQPHVEPRSNGRLVLSESFIEDQYFPPTSLNQEAQSSTISHEIGTAHSADAPAPVSFVDEQFFGVKAFERRQIAEQPSDAGSCGALTASQFGSGAVADGLVAAAETIATVAGVSAPASFPTATAVGHPPALGFPFTRASRAATGNDGDAVGMIEAQYFGDASMSDQLFPPPSSTSGSDVTEELGNNPNQHVLPNQRRPVTQEKSRNVGHVGERSAAPSADIHSAAEIERGSRPPANEGSIIERLRRLSVTGSEADRSASHSSSRGNGSDLNGDLGRRPLDRNVGVSESRQKLAPLELSPRGRRESSEQCPPRWQQQQQQLGQHSASGSRRAADRQWMREPNSVSEFGNRGVSRPVPETVDDSIVDAPSGGSITDRLRQFALTNSSHASRRMEDVQAGAVRQMRGSLSANYETSKTRADNTLSLSKLPREQKRRADSQMATHDEDDFPAEKDGRSRSWGSTGVLQPAERQQPLDAGHHRKDGGVVSPRDDPGAPGNAGLARIKGQVRDWRNETVDTVVYELKKAVVFQSDELLAVNKPYGLASHGGPEVHHSIAAYLPRLASAMNIPGDLHLVHRLDRDTTGVLLLAKKQMAAVQLQRMFQQRQIIKQYWALTRGVPEPSEGIVDIPLAEGSCDGQYRMKLAPSSTNHSPAVTRYKVLSQHGSCALVEVEPVTGVKHQIRIHLAFGLDAAILGDHKYSHKDKMAPQRLFPDLLNMLGITQAKVRHLPMHLHARSIVVPEFDSGRNVFITASLPQHFLQTMRKLKVARPPSGDSQ